MTILIVATGLMLLAGLGGLLGLRYRGLGLPFIVGAAIRLLVGALGVYAVPFRLPYSGHDAQGFERAAWNLAAAGWGAIGGGLNPLTGFDVTAPFALIYRVVGREPMALVLYNVLLGALTIALVYRTVRTLAGGEAARRAAWIMALFPAAVLMSALILREAGVAFGLAVSALGMVEAVDRHEGRWLVPATGGIAFAALLHGGVLFIGLVVFFALALAQLPKVMIGGRVRPGPAVVTGLAGFIVSISLGLFATGTLSLPSVGVVSLETVQSELIREDPRDALGGSSYFGGRTTETWGDAVVQLPARVGLFMFSPLPWTVRSPTQVIGLLDGVIWMGIVVLVLMAFKRVWRDERARLLLLLTAAGVLVYAMGTTNAGTALRHRTKIIPALLPLVAFAWAARRSAKVTQAAEGPDVERVPFSTLTYHA